MINILSQICIYFTPYTQGIFIQDRVQRYWIFMRYGIGTVYRKRVVWHGIPRDEVYLYMHYLWYTKVWYAVSFGICCNIILLIRTAYTAPYHNTANCIPKIPQNTGILQMRKIPQQIWYTITAVFDHDAAQYRYSNTVPEIAVLPQSRYTVASLFQEP